MFYFQLHGNHQGDIKSYIHSNQTLEISDLSSKVVIS